MEKKTHYALFRMDIEKQTNGEHVPRDSKINNNLEYYRIPRQYILLGSYLLLRYMISIILLINAGFVIESLRTKREIHVIFLDIFLNLE